MTRRTAPRLSALTERDAIALLERNHVGRLAYCISDRVDLEPISYVYSDGWIHARTSPGTKLAALRRHPWVAFEVDEVHGPLDWESVVARGTVYFPDPERGEFEREAYEAALETLRTIDADAMTGADAVPHRRSILRIHIDEITGRRAEQG